MTPIEAIAAAATAAVGSTVQGAVGFGANLLAAPILVLIDPVFAPGPVTISSLVLNVVLIARSRATGARPDRRIRFAIAGLVPGVALAGVVVAVVSQRGLALLLAAATLAGVLVAAAGREVRVTPGALFGAGATSGLMGTVSGIGGPPIALLYQRADGPTVRGTLPRFFLAGGLLAIPALTAAGRLGGDELVAAAVLLPGTLAGAALSAVVARRLNDRAIRPVVLALSALAGLAVIAREVL